MKDKDLKYMHFISGQDFPVKSADEITEFLEANRGKEFFEYFEMPDSRWNTFDWSIGGPDRLMYYYPYDIINVKRKHRLALLTKFVRLQSKLGFSRKLPKQFSTLYGGSAFWTLSRQCVRYISDYLKHNPSYLKRFSFTYCAEEIIFPTIIMNSPFAQNVVNDNLRYIVWEYRNGNNPANLDMSDYEDIIRSNKLFARKFEFPVSQPLLSMLQKELSI